MAALAATVSGEPRKILLCLLPMRPIKLRLLDEMQVSPAARSPLCSPTHTPQVGARITAPASASVRR